MSALSLQRSLSILQNRDPTTAPDSIIGGSMALMVANTYQEAGNVTFVFSFGK